MASSSKERWSGSNRDSGRDGGTARVGVSQRLLPKAAEHRRRRASSLLLNATVGLLPFCSCPLPVKTLIGYSMDAHTSRYFDWLDEYVVKCDAQTSKAAYLGATKQVNGSFCGAYQFELKCRELEDRLIGLESHSSESKHVKSDLKCTSISCLVLGFVTGIAIASIIRVLG